MPATATPYKGTIKIDTTNTMVSIGAWSVSVERETSEGKPPITATSTGAKPITAGGLKTSGSLSGQVFSGPETVRAYAMTKFKAGVKVTLDLVQIDGIGFAMTGVLFTKVEFSTDSEETPTFDIEFTADDYTYDDDSLLP